MLASHFVTRLVKLLKKEKWSLRAFRFQSTQSYHSLAETESRSASNYNSRSGGGSGGGNGYEDENPYDGEREDSDQESQGHHSGGGGNSKRYYDRDQENNNSTSGRSSAQRTNSGIDKSAVTATTVAPKPAAAVVQPKAKKIDLGAAASFGKSSNLDINSPTHTAGPVTGGDLIDDFSDDLFNAPAAASSNSVVDNSQEFGDFSSAFGPATTTPTIVNSSNNNEDDFADFSAFESSPSTGGAGGGVGVAPAMPAFSNIPSPLPPTQQPQSDNLLLMGIGVNTMMGGAPSSHSPAMGAQDLLADFGDLNLNQPSMGASTASGE